MHLKKLVVMRKFAKCVTIRLLESYLGWHTNLPSSYSLGADALVLSAVE